MLETILGNKSAVRVLQHIYLYEEVHASQIANDHQIALDPIRNQLERFETAGLLNVRIIGRMKLYSFNQHNPYFPALLDLIKISLEQNTLQKNISTFRGLNEIN